MKKWMIIVIVSILIVTAGFGGAVSYRYLIPSDYYTQIDNSKMEQIDPRGGVVNFEGSQPFKYTLICYSKFGGKRKLSFTASRELRDGAFIQLDRKPFRGVVSWNEIYYENLPLKVKDKYTVK